ncbi:GNAT family N-acetyltransferase [Moritella dasanensis]|uniref:GNAT family N-acetyltransferase n=1 Tax=Moritella dasanensis TaxID=428031 RepID=UPI0012F7AC3F|nr:GNAT family N-acetyltransferase [Moritella dasanensis]
MMKIRQVSSLDWEHIYQLIEDNMFSMQEELGLDWNRESIIKHYMSKSVLVGEYGRHIIGFIAYDVSVNNQMIHSLQISREYQNGLCGFRLLKAVLTKEQANFDENAQVLCRVFDNNVAKEQYFSLGFKEAGRNKGVLNLKINRHQLLERLKLEHNIYK